MIGKIAKMVLKPSGTTVLGVLGAAALACYIAEHRGTLKEVATNIKTNISDKIEGIKYELNNVKKCTVAKDTNSDMLNEPTEVSSYGEIDKATGVVSEDDTEVPKCVSDSEKAIVENVLHHLDTAVSLCKGVMTVLHKDYGVGVFTDSENSISVGTTGDSVDVGTTGDSADVDNDLQREASTENDDV